MQQIETIFSYLEVVGGIHGIFLTFLLLRVSRPVRLANKLLAMLLFAVSFLLLWSALHDSQFLLYVPDLFVFGPADALVIGPLLFIYVKAMIEPRFHWKKIYWLHFLPAIVFMAAQIPFYLKSRVEKQDIVLEHYQIHHFSPLSSQIPSLQLLIYIIPILLMLGKHSERIKNYYSNIERLRLNWLRNLTLFFTFALIVFIIFFLISGIHVAGISISLLLAAFIFIIGYQGIRRPYLFSIDINSGIPDKRPSAISDHSGKKDPATTKYERSGMSEEAFSQYEKKLNILMEEEKLYRDSELNLRYMAERLSISTHHLSQMLNQHLQTNFYDFVNQKRVREVKKELLNPKKDYLTILAIALDAGFKSKAAFNAAFKKHEGITPSEYKKSQQERV